MPLRALPAGMRQDSIILFLILGYEMDVYSIDPLAGHTLWILPSLCQSVFGLIVSHTCVPYLFAIPVCLTCSCRRCYIYHMVG